MEYIGKNKIRVDAFSKVTGTAKYTTDLIPNDCLVAGVLHSTIANGEVIKMDIEEAKKVKGVVKIFTCFDVPDYCFPTAGKPWSKEKSKQAIMDRKLLNKRVRLYGDDIAAVVAEDEIALNRALKLIRVEYKEYKVFTTARETLENENVPLHEDVSKDNIIAHTIIKTNDSFDYEKAKEEAIKKYGKENLVEVIKNVKTPCVSHCHLELPVTFAYVDENGKITVVSSTQIPHILKRIIGQALGIDSGKIRVIKPYVGGGFGNKQDALYEPLCAFLSLKCNGRPVFLEISRESTISNTKTRHAMDGDIKGLITKDGKLLARELVNYCASGGYAGHGHNVTETCSTTFKNLYVDELGCSVEAFTIYTNTPNAAAMRAYGVPQAISFAETLTDDLCFKAGLDPLKFRLDNCIKENAKFGGSKFYSYGLKKCLEIGAKKIDWYKKREEYKVTNKGKVRRGLGLAMFIYETSVAPDILETASVRIVLNQDGSIQLQLGATEIGQGADTVMVQICAEATGISPENIYIMSMQDTDITPFDTGAYASRQTYVTGNAIKSCGELFKNKICKYALTMNEGLKIEELDVCDNKVINKITKEKIFDVKDIAFTSIYSIENNEHIVAEKTTSIKTNTYSSGCSFCDITIDMPLGIININKIINVHDSGTIINPALAAAQVHGGMLMSLGYGMSEELLIDKETGKPYNNNFLDYKIPTAMDSPDFDVEFVVIKDPTGGYGNKSLGEPPTITPATALRNALLHATGCSFNEFPFTPERLVKKFKEERLI